MGKAKLVCVCECVQTECPQCVCVELGNRVTVLAIKLQWLLSRNVCPWVISAGLSSPVNAPVGLPKTSG